MPSTRLSVPGFAGPSNVLQATHEDMEDTINFYLEAAAPGTGQAAAYLKLCPGAKRFGLVNDTPGRALFFENGRGFGVTGTTFYEFFIDGTVTPRGTLTAGGNHVSIVSNGTAGNQLLICNGFDGYNYALLTNTLTKITTANYPGTGFPDGNASCVEFMDGYGIVLVRNSRQFLISALEDFTSWDPLDVAERSEGSDSLVTIVRNHRELWLPGTQTGEVWYDSGDPLFPFAPVPGVFLEYGAAGGTSSGGVVMCRFAGTVAWLGQNEYGGGVINLARGYQPERISTFAIETSIEQLKNSGQDPTHAFCFAQTQAGHEFLWWLFPSMSWTYVYDKTMNSWHKRALWNTTTSAWAPHLASCGVQAFQKLIVASKDDGRLYELRLDQYTNEVDGPLI